MLKRLDTEESEKLIARGGIGRLACISEGWPYVVPVSYIYANNFIYVHSLAGRKITAMRENPRACFQVDEIRDVFHWKSAIAFGTFEEVTDAEERDWAVRRLLVRFPQLTPVESVPVHDGGSSVILFRIRVDSVTGVGEF
jgi:hypothetical protein